MGECLRQGEHYVTTETIVASSRGPSLALQVIHIVGDEAKQIVFALYCKFVVATERTQSPCHCIYSLVSDVLLNNFRYTLDSCRRLLQIEPHSSSLPVKVHVCVCVCARTV